LTGLSLDGESGGSLKLSSWLLKIYALVEMTSLELIVVKLPMLLVPDIPFFGDPLATNYLKISNLPGPLEIWDFQSELDQLK